MSQSYSNSRLAARWAAIALLSVIIAGCQIEAHTPSSVTVSGNSQPGQADSDSGNRAESPQQTFNNNKNTGDIPVVNAIANEEKTGIADAKMESSPGKASQKEEKKWNPEAPKLHGISIGDAQSGLAEKLGKPIDSYSFEDEDETLIVNEYSGFSVGLGQNKKVKFVEVFDSGAMTGLNGLRVGQDVNSAVKLLGKPDTHTASLLAYNASGALLKLDLDPDDNTIVSIKLFLNSDQP
ncbi:hypothetical protein KZ483_11805 [Paenibacillus sp. sptzw28]|uniref:hypothetical protein n=1 Tax=Paenibacillus sp. sptzw28 TaxID=715179 RepID=UPI001C6E19B0|nr:hypothetical protein [Paenibacillus sp. sptzw28]QYR23533.1 hypothetical protein KZ483_11805 [Paenibacillus sp. sptzw28]